MASKAMAVVPQLGWVCYSNGSKVHVFHPATLKEVGVLDLEAAEGASPGAVGKGVRARGGAAHGSLNHGAAADAGTGPTRVACRGQR